MFTLPICSWLYDAVAALSGRYGAVTERAAAVGCSRQTVYNHAQAADDRLAERDAELAQVQAELAATRAERDLLRTSIQRQLVVQPDGLRHFAIVGLALGISSRQAEELLGTLLPVKDVPDHSTLNRWSTAAAKQATAVLAEIDPLCHAAVETLCVDEIFFRGYRH
jgi:hypothetical protein